MAGSKLTNKLLIGDLCGVKLDSHALSVSRDSGTDISINGVARVLATIAVTNGRFEVREVLQEYMFCACGREWPSALVISRYFPEIIVNNRPQKQPEAKVATFATHLGLLERLCEGKGQCC